MATFLLPLLFIIAGCLGIWYYRTVPSGDHLRTRLPNRVSWAAWVVTAVIAIGIWYISRSLSTPFLRFSGATTLLFYLLVFESALLLIMRWTKSNLTAVIVALAVAAIPLTLQLRMPSYFLINVIIVLATLGATTLLIRLNMLRTRLIVLMAVLLTINDAINVWFVLPLLPLSPLPPEPLPFLILPTVSIAGRVVGSGDFMFLVLATLVIIRDHGQRSALVHVGVQTAALFFTLLVTANRDVLIPYLLIMTPIFFGVYFWRWRATKRIPHP